MTAQHFKWILITSLVLNVFMIGGIIGSIYHLYWSGQLHVEGNAQKHGLRFAAENLSAERQQVFRKILRESRRDARPLIEASQNASKEALKLLREPTFDRPAFAAAISRKREADLGVRMRMEQSLIGFAENLPQDERNELAAGLSRHGPLQQTPQLQLHNY